MDLNHQVITFISGFWSPTLLQFQSLLTLLALMFKFHVYLHVLPALTDIRWIEHNIDTATGNSDGKEQDEKEVIMNDGGDDVEPSGRSC